MDEPKLETEEVMVENMTAKEEEQQVRFLKSQIERQRRRDNIELCSDVDNLYYVCNECVISLNAIKRN